MRLTREQRKAIEVIEGEGLRTLSVRRSRTGHLKVRVSRKDGTRKTFVVACSASCGRSLLNLRALVRRFIKE